MVANDARSALESLLNEMRPLLLVAGVPEHQIHMRVGEHKIKTCVTAYDWLHKLFMSYAYRHLAATRALLPEEVWRRYDMIDLTETREQLLLEKYSKAVVSLWKSSRPRLFGTDRPSDLDFVANPSRRHDTCRP